MKNKPPLKSIRSKCLECCNGSSQEVNLCLVTTCALWPYRFGNKPPEDYELTPLKAIRGKCLDCSCYQPSEVKDCEISECPVFRFRMGKNPKRQNKGGVVQLNLSNLSEIPHTRHDLATISP